MTSVLVVNAGSSSLKLRVLSAAEEVITSADLSPWDGSPDDPGLRRFLGGLPGVGATGHRVVHGGHRFTVATPIDNEVVAGIGALTDLAPLHQAAGGLEFLGVAVDEGRNATARPDCDISAPGAAVRTLVIAAREDIEIARQTRAALATG